MSAADRRQGTASSCGWVGLRPEQASELLAYLLTSAGLCSKEPLSYGMFRLVDAAGRLADAMLGNLPAEEHAWLRNIAADMEARKGLVMHDLAAFEEFVEQLAEQVVGSVLSGLESPAGAVTAPAHAPEAACMYGPSPPQESSSAVLTRLLETRRVVRSFIAHPVPSEQMQQIVRAGGQGTAAGNRRIQEFLIVDDPGRIRAVKAFAPGIWKTPAALIVIVLDLAAAERSQVQMDRDETVWIDVGIAAMNMMLMAHALGLGSCPVSSFSRRAVRLVLGLRESLRPAFIVQLGWSALPRSSDPDG